MKLNYGLHNCQQTAMQITSGEVVPELGSVIPDLIFLICTQCPKLYFSAVSVFKNILIYFTFQIF